MTQLGDMNLSLVFGAIGSALGTGAAGMAAIALGAAVVWFLFPKRADEIRLLDEYNAEDTAAADAATPG